MSRPGRFITVEGVEGVGKSTSMAFIEQYLASKGIDWISTREPGGTQLAEEIRRLLLDKRNMSMHSTTELLLMFAARAQHVEELIKPCLAEGTWVICDRFTDSTYAYQGGGRGIALDTIARLEEIALGGFVPDLTLVLDLPVAAGMARANQRGEQDRFESEDLAFFERVREVFLARAESAARYHVIDASGDIDTVSARIGAVLDDAIAAFGAG